MFDAGIIVCPIFNYCHLVLQTNCRNGSTNTIITATFVPVMTLKAMVMIVKKPRGFAKFFGLLQAIFLPKQFFG